MPQLENFLSKAWPTHMAQLPGDEKSPPEIDALIKKLYERVKAMKPSPKPKKRFSKKNPFSQKPSEYSKSAILSSAALLMVVVWGMSGIYMVHPNQIAAVIRMGHYLGETQPGLHWFPRPIEDVEIFQKSQNELSFNESVLTADGVFLDLEFSATYTIDDLRTFLLRHNELAKSLSPVVLSQVLQVLLKTPWSSLLESKSLPSQEGIDFLNENLKQMGTGIHLLDLRLNSVRPSKGLEENVLAIKTSLQKEQELLEQATQNAASLNKDTEQKIETLKSTEKSHAEQVKHQAEVDMTKWRIALTQYRQYPQITQQRLYQEALDELIKKSHVIFVDAPSVQLNIAPISPPQTSALTNGPSTASAVPMASSPTTSANTTHKAAPEAAPLQKLSDTHKNLVRWIEAQQ